MVSSALLQRPLVCECVLIMYNSSKAADARHQYRHLVIRSTLLVKYLIPRGTNAVSINDHHTSLSQCDCERTPNRSPEQLLHVRTYTRACYTINNFLTNFRTPLQNRLFCASESTSTALSSFACSKLSAPIIQNIHVQMDRLTSAQEAVLPLLVGNPVALPSVTSP